MVDDDPDVCQWDLYRWEDVRFTVGHGPQHNRQVTNGMGPDGGATSTSFTMADLFGGTLLLPDGTVTKRGMTFSGTTSGGGTFSGSINNRIGAGWARRTASDSSTRKPRSALRASKVGHSIFSETAGQQWPAVFALSNPLASKRPPERDRGARSRSCENKRAIFVSRRLHRS